MYSSRMSKILSPSPMIECFVRNANEQFPEAERAKLDSFRTRIESTTSSADAHRSRRCAEWAIEMADDKDQAHPRWKEIKELHQVWKDTWFGLEMGVVGPQGARHDPLEDVHIQRVEDAVTVAVRIGEDDGWAKSPWEALLDELIDMEKNRSAS
jgi:hypothetical protein